jgi:hypothetical protein
MEEGMLENVVFSFVPSVSMNSVLKKQAPTFLSFNGE